MQYHFDLYGVKAPLQWFMKSIILRAMKKIMLRHNRRMFLLKDEAVALVTGACRQWHIGVGLFLKTITACRIAYQHHPHT